MNKFDSTSLDRFVIHRVGNSFLDEGTILSEKENTTEENLNEILKAYFLSSFEKKEEFYKFFHESNIDLNEIYLYAAKIFEDPNALLMESKNIAKHLYLHSNHPKIKGGELYVVYFCDYDYNGELIDVIGLFKSEIKDTFIKVDHKEKSFNLHSDKGINIKNLDKGCLILNTEKDDGYIVAVVDNTNKGSDAQYWIDDFLHIRQRQDEYYKTQNLMAMCKDYVVKKLPYEFEVNKADQAELLNKSAQYFKDNDNFDMNTFTEEVISQPEVIKSFNSFKKSYEQDHDIHIDEEFGISTSAVKKQVRAFKSVIKLDKNFHIYVHGDNQYIKRGYDEATGMYYYQLFFKEEL